MRCPRRGLAALLAIGAACRVATAHAGPFEPIRVEFAAPAGCPDAFAFADQVRARTAKARLAGAGEAARVFRVAVTQDAGLSRGQLSIQDRAGDVAIREVSGQTCTEVIAALALISALAIDPEASTAPEPPRSAATSSTGAPVLGSAIAAPAPFVPGPTWAAQPPGMLLASSELWAPSVPPPLPASLTPGLAQPRWRLAAGAHAVGVGAIAPGVSPGVAVFVDLSLSDGGLASPTFRVGGTLAGSSGVATGRGSSSFRGTWARVEGCPLRLEIEDGASVSPCVVLDAGALVGTGTAPVASAAESRPWIAAGVLGRLQLVLGDWLLLEAQGGVTFPFVRDTFVFDPGITIHEVPAAGGFFGGGLGLRFP